eukprot:TRINITY_DN5682_c0_g1_i1.p1 TRINITY_DN5682_c0_g1~~TRINITY_DN5682_c0_g1_i1.p1  ORF type:complete len:379 (-),score=49.27 TRINITY_DN5682_c0_g1_i1:128-1264(-)
MSNSSPPGSCSPSKRVNAACHFCDHAARRPGRNAVALQVACSAPGCRKVFCSRPSCRKKLPAALGLNSREEFLTWKNAVEAGMMTFICQHCADQSTCPGPQCHKRWQKRVMRMHHSSPSSTPTPQSSTSTCMPSASSSSSSQMRINTAFPHQFAAGLSIPQPPPPAATGVMHHHHHLHHHPQQQQQQHHHHYLQHQQQMHQHPHPSTNPMLTQDQYAASLLFTSAAHSNGEEPVLAKVLCDPYSSMMASAPMLAPASAGSYMVPPPLSHGASVPGDLSRRRIFAAHPVYCDDEETSEECKMDSSPVDQSHQGDDSMMTSSSSSTGFQVVAPMPIRLNQLPGLRLQTTPPAPQFSFLGVADGMKSLESSHSDIWKSVRS